MGGLSIGPESGLSFQLQDEWGTPVRAQGPQDLSQCLSFHLSV